MLRKIILIFSVQILAIQPLYTMGRLRGLARPAMRAAEIALKPQVKLPPPARPKLPTTKPNLPKTSSSLIRGKTPKNNFQMGRILNKTGLNFSMKPFSMNDTSFKDVRPYSTAAHQIPSVDIFPSLEQTKEDLIKDAVSLSQIYIYETGLGSEEINEQLKGVNKEEFIKEVRQKILHTYNKEFSIEIIAEYDKYHQGAPLITQFIPNKEWLNEVVKKRINSSFQGPSPVRHSYTSEGDTILFSNISEDLSKEMLLTFTEKYFDNEINKDPLRLHPGRIFKLLNNISDTKFKENYFKSLLINSIDSNFDLPNFELNIRKTRAIAHEVLAFAPAMKEEYNSFINSREQQYIPLALGIDLNKSKTPTSLHLKNNLNAANIELRNHFDSNKKSIKEIQPLLKKVNLYTEKQITNGNFTFFHGQSWNWNLYETFYNKLSEKNKKKLPENFTTFRYNQEIPSKEEQKFIMQHGINSTTYEKDRKNVLFANIALFANHDGSNSFIYTLDNFDQSVLQGRNQQELETIFDQFGLKKEFLQVKEEDPTIFTKINELHEKASKYGNLVTISIPKEQIDQLVYPTTTGAPRISYTLTNGEKTDSARKMIENAEHLPFRNEFCIVLGESMRNPEKAKAAGIEMKQWNLSNKELIDQRNALILEVIEKTMKLKNSKIN